MDEAQRRADALARVAEAESEIERWTRERARAIVDARGAGVPWQMIGDAVGVSRQAAWSAYSRLTATVDEIAGQSDLSEDEAMELAVSELEAVRRERRERQQRGTSLVGSST